MKRVMIMIAVSALAVLSGPAQAANEVLGKKLAQKLCVNCHIVEPGGKKLNAEVGIPSFMAIAKRDKSEADRLRGIILNPHPPMPQVQLTTHELDNIVAYILSLKAE